MIVLCDTSPICYLILIGQIDLLPQLFQSITIPTAVRDELLNEDAGDSIHAWIQNPPPWLNIQIVPQPLLSLPNYSSFHVNAVHPNCGNKGLKPLACTSLS